MYILENNESSLAKEKLLDNESTEKSRDKMLDDFIDSFKADKKRKSNIKSVN